MTDAAAMRLDMLSRVALCGYLESGLPGVVYARYNARGAHTVSYVPLMSDSVGDEWPAELRARLSHDILADLQLPEAERHFFVVSRTDERFDVGSIPRAVAEAVVQRDELGRNSQEASAQETAEVAASLAGD